MSFNFPSCTTAVSRKSAVVNHLAAILSLSTLASAPALAQAQQWPTTQTPELVALRSSSSPAEKKLSFNLLLLSRQARHASVGTFITAANQAAVNPDGTITVEITAFLSPSLVAAPVMTSILKTNGAISAEAYASDRLQAKLYRWQLLALAANPNVSSIREVSPPSSSLALATTPPKI